MKKLIVITMLVFMNLSLFADESNFIKLKRIECLDLKINADNLYKIVEDFKDIRSRNAQALLSLSTNRYMAYMVCKEELKQLVLEEKGAK